MAGRKPAVPGKSAALVTGIWAIVIAPVVAVVCLAGPAKADDGDTTVPPPTPTEIADTVAVLRRSADSQGLCYGWRLQDANNNLVSFGSNLGDGVAVESKSACPRWIEVVATINYTPESSELEDSASLRLVSNGDPDTADLDQLWNGLARFGLTEDVFVDDPGWAICRAAVTLPLLAAERGIASPAPVLTAAPATPPTPLPDAGSDLWRDRWGYFFGSTALFLITALLVTVGLVQRRRQRRAADEQAARRGRRPRRTPERA